MRKNLLLTGYPGCGKTTVIQKVLARFPGQAGGFYTSEIRTGDMRKGFEIVTLDGRRGVLAHVDIRGSKRVGKYGLDLTALDRLGVGAILATLSAGGLVVIDEIGPMEIASPHFRETVLRVLDSPATLLGTIARRSLPFTDAIKRRPDVELVEVTPTNRDDMPERILKALADPI